MTKRVPVRCGLGLALAAVLALASPALAQQMSTTPYGAPLTLDMAKKAIAAAEAEAKKNNWPVAIAVVDSTGHLVAFEKIDNTQYASVGIAQGKAMTALNFRRPTKALEDGIAGGGAALRILAVRGVTPLEGGINIEVDGKIVGAIGVSGVLSSQDAMVAKAGADGLK